MSQKDLSDLFFFITNSRRHFDQAVISALRINELMPNHPIAMFITDPLDWGKDELPTEPFKTRVKINAEEKFTIHNKWYLTQNHLMEGALDCLNLMGVNKAIYLDCDTYMIDPVPELFDLLEGFEFAGAHAPGRKTAPTVYDIPMCFPEINIGVNPMVVNSKMTAFWGEVAEKHLAHLDVFGNNDQAPLRQVLHEHRLTREFPSFYILPPEYNLRFHFAFAVKGRVKILHGPQEYAPRVAELINENQGAIRGWTKVLECLG